MTSVNKGSFISSFSMCMHFISFSCLIALAKNSSMILNKSGESRHPYLVSDLRGKAPSFWPLLLLLSLPCDME